MSVADRMINPLGFKVSSYRKSAEALTAPEPTTAATPAVGVAARAVLPTQGAGPAAPDRP
jgi:type IV secretion system protein VirB8